MMWESIQFISIIIMVVITMLLTASTLVKFAIYSELLWLGFLILTSYMTTSFNSVEMSALPFIILVLTAVEAVIIWTILVSTYREKL
jgi:NADH:ubiquinone oxidoreductase subunit K